MNVWVNGCFDILHYGHFRLLNYAASFGKLVVGVDSDSRIRRSKGESRPYHTLDKRMYNLQSIASVSVVDSFDTDDELKKLIKKHNCKIMVIGSDYINAPIVGSELFDRIIYFERLPELSTTSIIQQYG
jgi:D-beta-D-heptose 7-phosphate kinase/D-beta-D-heptose 1-phosphate adenosyltransferase